MAGVSIGWALWQLHSSVNLAEASPKRYEVSDI